MKLRLPCVAWLFTVQMFSQAPAFSKTFSTGPITSGGICTFNFTINNLAAATPAAIRALWISYL